MVHFTDLADFWAGLHDNVPVGFTAKVSGRKSPPVSCNSVCTDVPDYWGDNFCRAPFGIVTVLILNAIFFFFFC